MMREIKCDFCDQEATVDGKTNQGPWANMCKKHFKIYGVNKKGLFTTLANVGKPGRKPYSD